jgi:hypothetical protein
MNFGLIEVGEVWFEIIAPKKPDGPMTNEQALNIIGEGIGLPKSY